MGATAAFSRGLPRLARTARRVLLGLGRVSDPAQDRAGREQQGRKTEPVLAQIDQSDIRAADGRPAFLPLFLHVVRATELDCIDRSGNEYQRRAPQPEKIPWAKRLLRSSLFAWLAVCLSGCLPSSPLLP